MALHSLRWRLRTAAVAASLGFSYCAISLVSAEDMPRATRLVQQPSKPASKTAVKATDKDGQVKNAVATEQAKADARRNETITQVKAFQSGLGPSGTGPAGAGPSGTGPQAPSNVPSPQTSSASLSGSTANAGTPGNTASPSQAAQTTSGTGTNLALNSANTAGANTTGDILKNVASISTKRTSAINLDPRVRGFLSSQVNASANGMTQFKTRVDIDSLFSNIDVGIVKNIQVVDGPYDSRFGPGFAFLIADLFPAERYSCGTELHGSTILDYGTNGRGVYGRQNLRGGSDFWGFYASYGNRTGTGYYAGDDVFDLQVPADYHVWDGYFALGVDVTSNSRAEFNYIRSERNTVELPGVIYDIVQQKDEQFNVRWVMQTDKDGPENAIVQYWSSFTPYNGNSTRSSKHTTFYDQFITDNYFFDLAGPNGGASIQNTFSYGYMQTQGARGLVTLGEKDTAQLTVGGDWRRYSQQYIENHVDGTGAVVPTLAFGTSSPFGIPRSTMEDVGIFSHVEIPTCDDYMKWKVGGRLDWTNSFVNGTQDDPVTANNTPQFEFPGKPSNTLYMAYIDGKTRLGGEVYLTTGLAFAMRQANLSELYTDNAFVPLVQKGNSLAFGNSFLKPEENLQVDVGIVGKWGDTQEWGQTGRVAAGFRAFHSNINNYILYRPFDFTAAQTGITGVKSDDFASRTYQYVNLDRARLYGMDAFSSYRLSKWISLSGKVAWVEGVNESPNWTGFKAPSERKSSEPLPNIYPFNATLGFLIAEPEKQKYGVEWSTRMVVDQNSVANSLFEYTTPGYVVCDLRGFWLLKEAVDGRGASVRMTGGVENVFDKNYYDHGSLAVNDAAGNFTFVKAPGIGFRIGLQVDY